MSLLLLLSQSGAGPAAGSSLTATVTTTASGTVVPASGLAIWYRAADLSGLADGTAISSWTSTWGTSTASQATGTNQPTKQTVNGITVVRFDGSNDRLSLNGDALTLSQNKGGVTIFARVKMNALTSTNGYIVHLSNGLSVANDRAAVLARSTGAVDASGRRLDADTRVAVTGGSIGTTAIRTLVGLFDYTNNDLFIYMDGSTIASNLNTWGAAGNTSNTASLGADFGTDTTAGSFGSMDLYEVLVYSRALTTAERQQVENYFLITAGLTATATITAEGSVSAGSLTGTVSLSATATVTAVGGIPPTTTPVFLQPTQSGVRY